MSPSPQSTTAPYAQEFAAKGVLVTGGGSGIGAALVEAFHLAGAKVAFIDIDERSSLSLVARLSAKEGAAPIFLKADLRDQDELAAAVNNAGTRLGTIRVLVNNAARDDRHDIDSVTSDYWDENQAINLKQVFFVTQAALPYLRREAGASIVNFSSISYLLNMGDLPSYATAKAGLIGLTKSLAGRLGREHIRVNAILPGMIVTERQKELWLTETGIAATVERQCLKRALTAADLVGPCFFLASDASGAMTAQTMIIDGGLL